MSKRLKSLWNPNPVSRFNLVSFKKILVNKHLKYDKSIQLRIFVFEIAHHKHMWMLQFSIIEIHLIRIEKLFLKGNNEYLITKTKFVKRWNLFSKRKPYFFMYLSKIIVVITFIIIKLIISREQWQKLNQVVVQTSVPILKKSRKTN